VAIVPITTAGVIEIANGSVLPAVGHTYVLTDIAAIPASVWLDMDGPLTGISVTDVSLDLSVAAARST
jgi:hypothetical protein